MENERKKENRRPPDRQYREPPEDSGAPKMRTWGFIVGAVVLLAILTVVLCVMAGVFDFGGGGDSETEPPAVQTQQPESTTAPDATEPPSRILPSRRRPTRPRPTR